MFEQMEESVDRCWAYNRAGQRCEMIAGHDGLHNIVMAWGNDECWRPGDTPALPPMVVTLGKDTVTAIPIRPDAPAKPAECLCGHPMHRGDCRVGKCDCREGIEV